MEAILFVMFGVTRGCKRVPEEDRYGTCPECGWTGAAPALKHRTILWLFFAPIPLGGAVRHTCPRCGGTIRAQA